MTVSAIMSRRSIRKFTDEPIEKEVIERLLRAAMQAPSAKNSQPWEFIVVTDPELKAKVAKCSEYGGFTAGAACAIIPLADTTKYPGGQPWWTEDLSAATENILLCLEEEGLGGCWIGIWPEERRVENLRSLFNIPNHLIPFSIIACGHKAAERPFEDRYDEKRVHWNKY